LSSCATQQITPKRRVVVTDKISNIIIGKIKTVNTVTNPSPKEYALAEAATVKTGSVAAALFIRIKIVFGGGGVNSCVKKIKIFGLAAQFIIFDYTTNTTIMVRYPVS